MHQNLWTQLRQQTKTTATPFFALAPMADVTDPAFRIIVSKYSRHGDIGGGPDVFWTEFVSADGLAHPVGRVKLMRDLEYSEIERPIIAQLFSSNPENMRKACQLCSELGFDGIDINMGCPDRTIEKQGCGSAMIKTPERAIEVINAAKQGIADSGRDIPLSVKTRVGYNKPDIENWIGLLLQQNIAALTVHARTRKDLSIQPANWDYIAQVVALRDKLAPDTVIIGNGDINDLQSGIARSRASGCDGIMIGRAAFGNPWLFDTHRSIIKTGNWNLPFFLRWLPRSWTKKIMGDNRYTLSDVTVPEKLRVLVEHSELFVEKLGDIKSFSVIKKHYKAYCNGFNGAKDLRNQLMQTQTVDEVRSIVNEFLKQYQE